MQSTFLNDNHHCILTQRLPESKQIRAAFHHFPGLLSLYAEMVYSLRDKYIVLQPYCQLPEYEKQNEYIKGEINEHHETGTSGS